MRVVVLITACIRADWFHECVESVVACGFDDIRAFDDASPVPLAHPRIHIARTESNGGAYASRAALLDELARDEAMPDDTVVALMDGDDTLRPQSGILDAMRATFADPGVGVANFGGRSLEYIEALSDLRHGHLAANNRWLPGVTELLPAHMRAFRLGLYRRIRRLDPEHDLGRHPSGEYIRKSTDRALLAPMILAAGHAAVRIAPLDVYNYRMHSMMTAYNRSNKSNAAEFPEILTRLMPPSSL